MPHHPRSTQPISTGARLFGGANRRFQSAFQGLLVPLFALLGAAVGFARAAEPSASDVEFFEKKIRPILAERCYRCHSTRSEKLKGGLLLDSREGVLKGGEDGPVVVPGSPEKSKLVEAIHYQNPDLQMPPKGKLAENDIAALTEWVKIGLPWPREEPPKAAATASAFDFEKRRREHWAWQPIHPVPPPSTRNSSWPRNAVDQFLLAKLEQHHLQPAAPAEQRTWLRRLYFDLTGLPPTPHETGEFLDDRSPRAYEDAVDRLLASPHFGERWARHWLDLVRYAETLGHEFDYPLHNAWRYRDYVIRAFNTDVPYNQFVTEHIAGDLLSQPRLNPAEGFNESVIGTAFFWMGQREHSPVDVRQHQAELIDNQIDVMSKTFLGLTVACARCHDHKFDAIPTTDFYALYGVFESSRYAQKSIDPPATETIERLKKLKTKIRRAAIGNWSKQAAQVARYLVAAQERLTGKTNTVPSDLDADRLERWVTALKSREAVEPAHPLYAWTTFSKTGNLPDGPAPTGANAGSNEVIFASANAGNFGRWFPDGAAFAVGCGGPGDLLVGENDPPLRVVSEPVLNNAVVSRRLEGALRSPGFKIEKRYAHILAAGNDARVRICVDNLTTIREPIYGGLMRPLASDDLKWITVDLDMWRGHRAFIEFSDIQAPDPASDSNWSGAGWIAISRVVFSDSSKPPAKEDHSWRELRGSTPLGSRAELASRYEKALERALARVKQGGRSFSRPASSARRNATGADREEQAAMMGQVEAAELRWLDWLLEKGLLDSSIEPLKQWLAEYRHLEETLRVARRVPAMADGDGFDEHVFIRGNHKTPGEIAPRQFLAALRDAHAAPFKSGSGRLELARCITSSADPLLARVMVNRVWLHLFGRGIVATPDDFGALGQRPTHPELLDWLANWYRIEAGWSTKRLIRLLVTSSAYRMSSAAIDAVAEREDPDNTWFHRMPLKRLEGEAIRDEMLTVSGRLDDSMYGPSVPTHLTEFMEGRGRPKDSGPLDGARRRSIYLEVRRNFLSPMMRAFDTPIPFTTIGRRTVSNVPAQSLILLNDPFVVEQAQLWARRVLADRSASSEKRIENIYLEAFGRPPTAEERAKALAFLDKQGVAYGIATSEIRQDERVWTDLCHVAFNLKEFIFVE